MMTPAKCIFCKSDRTAVHEGIVYFRCGTTGNQNIRRPKLRRTQECIWRSERPAFVEVQNRMDAAMTEAANYLGNNRMEWK